MLKRLVFTAAMSILPGLLLGADGPVVVVDEVVAVVDATPILASDLELARLVELVPRDDGESNETYRSRLLDARIRLELEILDLTATAALYRLEPDVGRAISAFEARAGGTEALAAALHRHGLDRADLEALALRVAAVEAYVEQRLRPRLRIGLEELQRAYEELVVAPMAEDGQQPPPLVEVREQVSRVVAERQLTAEVEVWLDQIAARYEVTRFTR